MIFKRKEKKKKNWLGHRFFIFPTFFMSIFFLGAKNDCIVYNYFSINFISYFISFLDVIVFFNFYFFIFIGQKKNWNLFFF